MGQVWESTFKQSWLICYLTEWRKLQGHQQTSMQKALFLLFLPLIGFQKLLGHNWEKFKTYYLGDKWNILKMKIDIRTKKKERKPEENKYFQNHGIYLQISQLERFTNSSVLYCDPAGCSLVQNNTFFLFF